MKHVTVFGANGRVGRLVVEMLTENGFSVTTFVHNRGDLRATEQLRVVEGDIHNIDAVSTALVESDAVLSCLGSWGTPTKDILSAGMSTIIPAMEKKSIKRIVSLTGAEARASGDSLSLIHRIAHVAAGVAAGPILRDAEEHIRLLERSNLDWTVIRSPVMSEAGSAQTFRLTDKRPLPWQTIHRHAVALAIVQALNDSATIRHAPFISR